MSQPKHERPSGRLSKDATMMELVGVVQDSKGTLHCSARWTPVTQEKLDAIRSASVSVASVGYSLSEEAKAEILRSNTTYHVGTTISGETVKTITGLMIDSANLTPDGFCTMRGEVMKGYPKDTVRVIFTGLSRPQDNGEYTVPDHILGDIVRDAGSDAHLDIPESRTVNIREIAVKHNIDFDKLHDAFNKVMNPDHETAEPKEVLPKEAGTPAAKVPEHSGFDVNYYSVRIDHPKRPEREPYTFEVEDLIQALELGFHEGTILKSLVRSATARQLGLLKQGGDSIRDAEKMVHSAKEELRARKLRGDK